METTTRTTPVEDLDAALAHEVKCNGIHYVHGEKEECPLPAAWRVVATCPPCKNTTQTFKCDKHIRLYKRCGGCMCYCGELLVAPQDVDWQPL